MKLLFTNHPFFSLLSHWQCLSQISHLEAFTSIFALESIYTRWALKSFPAHHPPWARWTLRSLREDPNSHQSWNWNHQQIYPTYWWSSATRCSSWPWFSFLTLEKKVFQLHDRKFKPILTIIRVLSSQREGSYFMSLLDHLWILSALVVLLDLEAPNTIDTIYLNYTGLSVIINLNFRHTLILTGIPGAPASPLFPSTPFCPWKRVSAA